MLISLHFNSNPTLDPTLNGVEVLASVLDEWCPTTLASSIASSISKKCGLENGGVIRKKDTGDDRGVYYWNEELGLAQKCTGCAHLLDNGYAKPRCAEICPTEALVFGDEEELQDLIVGADVMNPEFGLGPRVYYRNIPGQFIAGTVYDPVEKEVIIGAKVRCIQGGKLMMGTTDEYGDFWFKDLSVGVHDVYIEAPGYKTVSFTGLKTTECINLGDIPMEKE